MDRRDTDSIDAFSRVLQKRRRKSGFSQEELAHLAGLSTSYVSLLETQKRQPTLSVLVVVAKALDLTFVELANDIEEMKKASLSS